MKSKINKIMKNFIRKFEFLAKNQMVIFRVEKCKTPMNGLGINLDTTEYRIIELKGGNQQKRLELK